MSAPATPSFDDFLKQEAKPADSGSPSFDDFIKAQPAPKAAEPPSFAQHMKDLASEFWETAKRPALGLADANKPSPGKLVVQPAVDFANEAIRQGAEPFLAAPGVRQLRDIVQGGISKGGELAGGAMDFVTSPVGLATSIVGGAGGPLVRGAVKSGFVGAMAPQAIEATKEQIAHPSAENLGRAIVGVGAAVLPVAPELATGLGKINPAIADKIDAHNAEAARLIREDQQAKVPNPDTGKMEPSGVQPTTPTQGTAPIKVHTDIGPVTVQQVAENAQGRPLFQVTDEAGKPVFSGTGQPVQQFLHDQGARPFIDKGTIEQPEAVNPEHLDTLVKKGVLTQAEANSVLDNQELLSPGEAQRIQQAARTAPMISGESRAKDAAAPQTGTPEPEYAPAPQIPEEATSRRDAALSEAAAEHTAAIQAAVQRKYIPGREGENGAPDRAGRVEERYDQAAKDRADADLQKAVSAANRAFEKEVGPEVVKQIAAREEYTTALRKRAGERLIGQPEGEPSTEAATKTARPAGEKPVVPEEGIPDRVARVQDARNRVAQQLIEKPFSEASNSERLAIDSLITQGHGFAVLPGEGKEAAAPVVEPPSFDEFLKSPEAAPAPQKEVVKPKAAQPEVAGALSGLDRTSPTPGQSTALSGADNNRGTTDVVQKPVLTRAVDLKVFDPIVSAIPVDVMNMLRGKQRATEMLLHDQSMLADALTSKASLDVFPNVKSLLPVIARSRAELRRLGKTADNTEHLSTLEALDRNLRERFARGIAPKASVGGSLRDVGTTSTTTGTETSPVGQRHEVGTAKGTNLREGHSSATLPLSVTARPVQNKAFEPEKPREAVAPTGHAAEVYTTKGTKVNVSYDVREAADILNSFEPGYPQEYQPRDTSRKGSRTRVDQRKADMNGALMADSRLAYDGAPIILDNGVDITRNHGTQALKELYAQESPRAAQYKEWLVAHAGEFGLDSAKISAMKHPVWARVITDKMTPEAVSEFAKEANAPSTARMSDAEVAAELAAKMTGPLMDSFDPTEDGRPNPEFVRELIKGLPVEEQAVFMDRDGNLSQTGARIVRNVIFAKAYPDSRALERMAEAESPTLKNLTAGMLAAAPKVAQLQEAVARGERFNLGIGPEIADAASVMDGLIREGTPLDVWLNQVEMFGRDPAVEALVKIFSDNRRSSKRIADFLKEYTVVADAAGDPRQESMFGPPEAPEKTDVIDAALTRAQERWQPQADLFGKEGEAGSGEVAPGKSKAGGPSEETPPRARKLKDEGSLFGEEQPSLLSAEPSEQLSPAEQDRRNNLPMFGGEEEGKSQADKQKYEDKLLGERLTAQLKSGASMGRTKLKPAETRSMFEDEGPEQDSLFSRRIPGFYSQLENVIGEKMPAKAAPPQVLAIIRNPNNGVKEDERQWSGIEDWLKEKSAPVTKHQVLDFVRANAVEVHEVLHGNDPELDSHLTTARAAREKTHDAYFAIGREIEKLIHDAGLADVIPGRIQRTMGEGDRPDMWGEIARYAYGILNGAPMWSRPDLFPAVKAAVPEELAKRYSDAVLADVQNRQKVHDIEAKMSSGPEKAKFAQYTSPGGENYRELLLTLPDKPAAITWKQEPDDPTTWTSQIGDRLPHAQGGRFQIYDLSARGKGFVAYDSSGWTDFGTHYPTLEQAKEAVGTARTRELRDDGSSYKSSHWDERNVLAHIRFDDRVTPDGKRSLHVAEVQSDWHQSGKRKGYRGVDPEFDRIKAELKRIDDRLVEIHGQPAEKVGAEEQRLWSNQQRLRSELDMRPRGQVPAAPFAKSWPELAVKRILRYAVENGYDSVSWDTGAQQADRYDLSKQIDRVMWFTKGEKKGYLSPHGHTLEAFDKDGRKVIEQRNVTPEKLPDYIGKDAAQKLVDSKSQESSRGWYKSLRGEGLKTQAPGMVGFYDKLLPAFMNKYVKKWGSKVEDSEISAGQKDGRVLDTILRDDFGTNWGDATEEQRQQAIEIQNGTKKPKAIPVHSVAITPAMRESIMNGQPLFAYRRIKGAEFRPNLPIPILAQQARAYAGVVGREHNHVLFVNGQAMDLMLRASGQRDRIEKATDALGITFLPGQGEDILHALEALPGAQQITEAVRKNRLKSSDPMIAVYAGKDVSDADLSRAINEEIDHATQMKATGRRASEHVPLDEFFQNPLAEKAFNTLRRGGYETEGDGTMVLEIGVRLMRPDRYREMGLTAQEAEELAEHYKNMLKQAHPAETVDPVVDKVYAAFGGQLLGRNKQGQTAYTFGRAAGSDDTEGVAEDRQGRGTGSVPRRVAKNEWQYGLFRAQQSDDVAPEDEPLFARREADPEVVAWLLQKSKAADQRRAMEENEGERGSVMIGALTLGLDKFVTEDVVPTAKEAATTLARTGDDILRTFLPASRGPAAKNAALIFRNRLAEYARELNQAQHAMATASKMFAKKGDDFGKEFILKYFGDENAPLPQFGDPEMDAIAKSIRNMLDRFRNEVQMLGTGKLQGFYQNYFGRVFKDFRKADAVMAQFFGKRPLEGPKAFLKKRKYPSWQDALDAGLEPVSWNPIDLMMLKIGEMARYTMAHRVLNDWKGSGLAKFVDARSDMKMNGWRKIDDAIGTVYGQSIQQISEFPNEGIYKGLMDVASALGVTIDRGFLKGMGEAIGRAGPVGPVRVLHGTAEDVLAHEIGHKIDFLVGSRTRFLGLGNPQTAASVKQARETLRDKASTPAARKQARETLKTFKGPIELQRTLNKELRALADLRAGRKEYTHKREEKMALLAEMWVGARPLFEQTAPTAFAEWKRFMDDHKALHPLRDIAGNTEVMHLSQPYDVGGLVIKGHWWAPEGAARIMNNYLSPGLRTTSGIYKSILGLNNVLNQFQLGLSAFHLGFTSSDAAVSKAALGFEQLFRGHPIKAAGTMAQVPLAPFTTFIKGNKVLKEWLESGSQGAVIGQIVDGLVAAGGRARMDEVYATQIRKSMMHAFRNGNIWGGIVRSPFAAIEMISDVIMRQVVPRQKLGVFADLAAWEMERLGPNATFEETRAALAKAWDSVENRMGQMTYDNLFWNRTAKDLAMISVRSVGWNLGTLREIGGGAMDTLKIPIQIAGGKPPREVSLSRIAYLFGLATVGAIMGAIYQYLHTGKGPEELKDYYFPKNGQLDENGNEQRSSMPMYTTDIYHYGTQPLQTLVNKTSPLFNIVAEMVHNRDFYGTEVRNEGDPIVKQMLDTALHPIKAAEPFTFRNIRRARTLDEPKEIQAEQFFGIRGAPAAVNQTKAERLARELGVSHIPVEGRTQAQTDRRKAERDITRLAQQGQPYVDKAKEYIESGVLTAKDVNTAARQARTVPLAREFNHLGIGDALRVWNVATDQERKMLRPMMVRKAASVRQLPAGERDELLPKVKEALLVNQ